MDVPEDDDVLIPKAFAIYEDISGYNPENNPTNGFEYLHQVICENSKLPKTMVASGDFDKFKANQTYYINENKRSSLRGDLLPSQEWQEVQIMDFRNLREKVSSMKEVWSSTKLSGTVSVLCASVCHLARQWHATENAVVCGTCQGECSVPIPSELSDEDSWLEFCSQSPPLLHVLFSIQQPGIMKLLNYFSGWLSDGSLNFTVDSVQWLYAILASLEEPLWPSTFADLRDILRLAREKRATIESSEDCLLTPLNLIICVGSRHFRQTDLCD